MSEIFQSIKELATAAWDKAVDVTGLRIIPYPLLHYPEDNSVCTLDVPGYRQTQTYTCGFVAGLMVLHYFDPDQSACQFYERVRPSIEDGTPTSRLVKALRASGIRVGERRNLTFDWMASFVKKGMPIITAVRRDSGISHWIVVYGVGYRPRRLFIAGDGIPYWDGRCELSYAEFNRKWDGRGEGLVCSKARSGASDCPSPRQSRRL
jgi:hypothetical protein